MSGHPPSSWLPSCRCRTSTPPQANLTRGRPSQHKTSKERETHHDERDTIHLIGSRGDRCSHHVSASSQATEHAFFLRFFFFFPSLVNFHARRNKQHLVKSWIPPIYPLVFSPARFASAARRRFYRFWTNSPEKRGR